MINPEPPPRLNDTHEATGEAGYPRAPLGDALTRNAGGWVLLIALFVFLLVVQYGRKSQLSPGQDVYSTEEAAVKMAVRQKALQKMLPTPTTATPVAPIAVDAAAANRHKDPAAARLYVTARYEAGEKVDPEDLAYVASTGKPADRAFAKIYGSAKLSEQEAKDLSSQMPSKEFAYNLARVHAYDKAGDSGPRSNFSSPDSLIALMVFGGFMALVGLAGCGLWVLYFGLRSQGMLAPEGHPAEPLSRPQADRFAFRAVLLMFLYLALQIVLAGALANQPLWLKYFAIYGVMLAIVPIAHRWNVLGMKIPLSRVGVRADRLGRDLVYGAAGYAASLPILIVMAVLGTQLMKVFGPSTHPATELIQSHPNAITVLSLFFGASIVAPFWEEIMFRGTLLPALGAYFGPVIATVLSSLMFASIHPQGVPLWPALGSIAVMNCLLAYQTKSLVPSMVLHCLNNTVVLIFGLLVS